MGDVPVEIHQKLDDLMQFKPAGVEFCDKVKADEWDGVVHLYRSRTFPVGLLERAEMVLILDSIPYEIIDVRTAPVGKPITSRIALRDYQKRIVEDAIMSKSGLIPVATGGGKTVIAAEIIARLGQEKALFIVPTIELLHQTVSMMRHNLDCPVSWVGEGTKELVEGERICVSTWQSISAGLRNEAKLREWREFLVQYNVLIADEVHHYSADHLFDVAMFSDARFRFGLSGTMFRNDATELKFIAAIGESIQGITASELIKLGYLVPPKIHFIKTKRMLFGQREKYADVYRVAVVENVERNRLIAGEALKLVQEGRRTLVLVSQIRHGEILKHLIDEMMPQYCIACHFDFVNSAAEDRPEIVEGFRNGTLPLLISTQIFDEGIDIREIQGIVLAGAGKSQIKAVQRVGRGLRICPEINKKDVKVIEICDVCKYLYDHAHERYEMYQKEPRFIITGDIPK